MGGKVRFQSFSHGLILTWCQLPFLSTNFFFEVRWWTWARANLYGIRGRVWTLGTCSLTRNQALNSSGWIDAMWVYNNIPLYTFIINHTIRNYLRWWLSSPNIFFRIILFTNLLLGGYPSDKIIWMLYIILGMVGPCDFSWLKLFRRGLRKFNYLRKCFRWWWRTVADCHIYFEGLWDDDDFFNQFAFFLPRTP